MKPRTKLQFEVMRNAENLPNIQESILSWGKEACLKHVGYATKNRVVCLDCGQQFSTELVKRKRAVCPHCSHKLVIEESRKSTLKQKVYVAKAELYGDFQLIRNFLIESVHASGKTTYYSCYEILQHWYLDDKKREVVARNHTVSWYCDSWNGYLEIRDKGKRAYWEPNQRYDVYPEAYHPDSVFKQEYARYGINKNLEELTFLEAVKILPFNPQAETLLKAGQTSLLSCFRKREDYLINRHWASIKICMRNKYVIKDVTMYLDYLDFLRYFKKDLHNAHYVCPKNLKREHDRLMKKKRDILKREEERARAKKALEDEKLFQELKKDFFGIVISDGELEIKTLESVVQHKEEGDAMHHCVFTNEYYLKPESLILSAQIEGKRVETVEVNIKTKKVVQSRGVCNNTTEYHDRIVNLVNRRVKKLILERTHLNKAL